MALTDDVDRYLQAMFPKVEWFIYPPTYGHPRVTIYASGIAEPWRVTLKQLQAPGSHITLLSIGHEATEKGSRS